MTKRPLTEQLKLSSARFALAAIALLFVAQWAPEAGGEEPTSAGAEAKQGAETAKPTTP